jgi:hypothetical protein
LLCAKPSLPTIYLKNAQDFAIVSKPLKAEFIGMSDTDVLEK